jgi:hypothetical protein
VGTLGHGAREEHPEARLLQPPSHGRGVAGGCARHQRGRGREPGPPFGVAASPAVLHRDALQSGSVCVRSGLLVIRPPGERRSGCLRRHIRA